MSTMEETPAVSRRYRIFLPLILAASFFHLFLSYPYDLIYLRAVTLVSLSLLGILAFFSHTGAPDREFSMLSRSFMLFALLYWCAELGDVLMERGGGSTMGVYILQLLWLSGYVPILYSCWTTFFKYAEYADVRSLFSTVLGAFSFFLILLVLIGVAVAGSPHLSSLPRKMIAIAYPYLDVLLLLSLLLLLHVYKKGKLASYWMSVTIGMFLFTFADLASAVTTGYVGPEAVFLFTGFYVMAYLHLAYAFGGVVYAKKSGRLMEPETLYTVRRIFLIHQSGLLLFHIPRRDEPSGGPDEDILGGMLSAVQNFIKDSFGEMGGETDSLKRLQYGNLEIHVENGRYTFMAVVLEGRGTELLHQKMRAALEAIEGHFGGLLADWDGDLEPLQPIRGYLEREFL
ncbi:MAG: hypothetical protein J7L61_01275 [Thermoplasmata archaeon]|nr:hypothetical protein [Thermoplasmata archaeon]